VVVDGEAVPYVAYSGGEKTRISLAVDMALCDLMNDSHGSSFNIVVFDEQDMWLDSEGREAYLRLLRERAKHQRVFVVSHDGELKAKFDSTWTVIKEGRISRFAA
jgi:DNA repair exonuclease SbcCD ATPase subunit